MSYCVNCGVELDESAKKCVLCNTPVYNPRSEAPVSSETPFSQTAIIPEKVREKFIALVITFVILIPNIVCMLINLFFEPERLWFIYLASSSFLCWVLFVLPFLANIKRPYLLWAFDTLAVALYVFVFHASNLGGEKWYFGIALPFIAICALCILYFIRWIRMRKRHWTSKVLHIFIDLVICLTTLGICLLLGNHIVKGEIVIIADTCCLALVFFWLYANKSKKVRAWLAKKLFV